MHVGACDVHVIACTHYVLLLFGILAGCFTAHDATRKRRYCAPLWIGQWVFLRQSHECFVAASTEFCFALRIRQ